MLLSLRNSVRLSLSLQSSELMVLITTLTLLPATGTKGNSRLKRQCSCDILLNVWKLLKLCLLWLWHHQRGLSLKLLGLINTSFFFSVLCYSQEENKAAGLFKSAFCSQMLRRNSSSWVGRYQHLGEVLQKLGRILYIQTTHQSLLFHMFPSCSAGKVLPK